MAPRYYQPGRKELHPEKPKKLPWGYDGNDLLYLSHHYRQNITILSPQLQKGDTAPKNPQNKPSLFMLLPTEVRLMIFDHLLASQTPLRITSDNKEDYRSLGCVGFKSGVGSQLGAAVGILLTSRQISSEALSILYSNTFHIKLEESCTRVWLSCIGEANRNRISRLGLLTWYGGGSNASSTLRSEAISKREFSLLASTLSTLKRLRKVEYQVEPIEDVPSLETLNVWQSSRLSIRDRPRKRVSPEGTVFKIQSNEFPMFHLELLDKYSVFQKTDFRFGYLTKESDMTWLTAWVTQSPRSLPKPKTYQVQSHLLSLPDPILEKILSYLCEPERVTIFAPLSPRNAYYTLPRGSLWEDRVQCEHLFIVCKKISAMSRRILYSRTEFVFQNSGLSISDKLNPVDFDQIRFLRLTLGLCREERQIRAKISDIRVTLRKLAQSSSRIQRLELAFVPLNVPFLTGLKPEISAIREKCQVTVLMMQNVIWEGDVDQDITWMLDTNPKIVWAWDHKDFRWRDFSDIEGKVKKLLGSEKGDRTLGSKLKKLWL